MNSRASDTEREPAAAGGARIALDTATGIGSIAVWRDGALRIEITLGVRAAHSEGVLPALEYALDRVGVAPAAVEELVIGAGPGSFTGVRIAASMARGWAAARGVPIFAYPSLMAVAVATGANGPVCAMFDARRGEVYAACYETEGADVHERLAPVALPVEEVSSRLADRGLHPVYAGEGALRYAEAIRARAPGARILPEHLGIPRASALLWLRETAPARGRIERPADWEPLYVREWRTSGSGEGGGRE